MGFLDIRSEIKMRRNLVIACCIWHLNLVDTRHRKLAYSFCVCLLKRWFIFSNCVIWAVICFLVDLLLMRIMRSWSLGIECIDNLARMQRALVRNIIDRQKDADTWILSDPLQSKVSLIVWGYFDLCLLLSKLWLHELFTYIICLLKV